MKKILLFSLFLGFSGIGQAQNYWKGTISSNWDVAGNWSAGVVPDSTGFIRIDAYNTTHPLVLTHNVHVHRCDLQDNGLFTLDNFEFKSDSSLFNNSSVSSSGGKINSEFVQLGNNQFNGILTLEVMRGRLYGNTFHHPLTLAATVPAAEALYVSIYRPDTFKGETIFINKGTQNGITLGIQGDNATLFDTTVFEQKFTFRNDFTTGSATTVFGNGENSFPAKIIFKGEVFLEGTHSGSPQPVLSFINAEFRQPVTVKMIGGTVRFGVTNLIPRSVVFNDDLLLDTPGTQIEFGDSDTKAIMNTASNISIPSGQMTSGRLRFYKFKSLTTTTQLIQLGGSGLDTVATSHILTTDSTDFAGPVYLRADQVQLNGGRFAGLTTVEQSGAASIGAATGTGINTINEGRNRFEDSLIVINRRSGLWQWESSQPDTHSKGIQLSHAALGTGWISLANTGEVTLPHVTVSSTTTASASGGIKIGYGADSVIVPADKIFKTADFTNGWLELYRFNRKGTQLSQSLNAGQQAGIRLEEAAFEPLLTVTAAVFRLISSRFLQASVFNKIADAPESWVDSSFFYDRAAFENLASSGSILFGPRSSEVITFSTAGSDSLLREDSTLPTEATTDRHPNKIVIQSGFEVTSNARYAAIIEPSGVRPNTLANIVPPNPDAAALGKYGEIPVSLYTGTPNITIPLYEITRAVNVPISLSYYASGVKVDDIASMVGLGWVLNAGGVITRSVHGIADEGSGGIQTLDGRTKYNQYITNAMTLTEKQTYERLVLAGGYDTEPDEYYYNFNGRSGKLVFDAMNQPFLVNHEKLKIVVDAAGFIITDEQGTKYHFTEKENTKPSTYCFDKSVSETSVSAWYLSKIQPLVGRSIDFSYLTRSNITYTQGLNQTARYYKEAGAYCTDDVQAPCKSVYRATVKQLQTITFDLGAIHFNYEQRDDLGFGWYRLKDLQVNNTNDLVIKKVELVYQYDSHPQPQRYVLKEVKETTDPSAAPIRYLFDYYNFESLPVRNDFAQDHWGYFNNNTASTLIPELPLSRTGITWADRSPDADKTKYGMLTKITYPTAGYTVFDYEAHDFGYVKTIEGSLTEPTGGVRIAKMTHYDALTAAHQVRKYEYRLSNNPLRSSGMLVGRPVYHYDYDERIHVDLDRNGSADVVSECSFLVGSSHSQVYLGGSQGSHIGYGEVTEYFEDGNANGKQWNQFTSFLDFPDYGDYSAFPFPPPVSYDYARGKLKAQKVYRYDAGTFYEVKSLTHQYAFDELSSVQGQKIMKSFLDYFQGGAIYSHTAQASAYDFKKIWMRLAQTDTYDFDDSGAGGIGQTTTYAYDTDHLQLKEIARTDSPANQTAITRYTYPLDYSVPAIALDDASQAIKDMQDNHVINTVVEQQYLTKYGSQEKTDAAWLTHFYPVTALARRVFSFSSDQGETSWTTGSINGSGVFTKDSRYRHDVTYDLYDAYGNPQQITPASGVAESVLWGYDGKLPIVRAVGVPYSVFTTVNASAASLSSASAIETYSGQVKTHLSANGIVGQVYTYLHEPLQGIQKVIAPNGLRTSFGYDGFQRLRWVKDHDDHYLSRYLYHYAASPGDKNQVRVSKLRVSTANESDADDAAKAEITYQYMDGLGRSVQTVGYQRSPLQKDILMQHLVYDRFGRTVTQLLPAPAPTATGEFQSGGLGLAQSFYGDAAPLNESTAFDQSPLNRLREQYGPGNAWRTASKKIQTFDESAGSDVRLYTLDGSDNIILSGTFPANGLYKKRTVDEQGNTSIEISDKRGRLVQKQQELATGDYATTYYLYDGLNRLKAVIQPEGYALNAGISYNSADWQRWVFFYRYDARGRQIEKHVPSGGKTETVYDSYDRAVWQRTALGAETGKWTFSKYDALNRLVMSGQTDNTDSRQTLQTQADVSMLAHAETRTATGPVYYSLGSSYPAVNEADLRRIRYFDDYTHWLAAGMGFDGGNAYHSQYSDVISLPAGMRSRNGTDNTWLASVNYYDSKGRVIQTFSANLYGQTERTDVQYNFAGEVLKNRQIHKDQSGTSTTQVIEHEYDHAGRKTDLYQTLNAGSREKLANYGYDEIGRQILKKIYPDRTYQLYGSTPEYIYRPPSPPANTQDLATKAIILQPATLIEATGINTYLAQIGPGVSLGTVQGLQTVNYSYHIRGMLNCVNCSGNTPTLTATQNDFFANKIEFEEDGTYYDGNIRKETWKSIKNTGSNRSYLYSYDPAKRIVNATYSGGQYAGENFGFSAAGYDKNGNIQGITRSGVMVFDNGLPDQFGIIDQMTYTYQGNRLQGITDAINGNVEVEDFRDNGNNSDYTYWNDGSLKSDANRGISQINWDSFLNKPQEINYTDGRWIRFYYDGTGKKLRENTSTGEQTDYTNGAIYKNGGGGQPILYQISQPEGRLVAKEGGGFKNQFDYKDHLGNLRLVYEGEGTPVSNVYPAPVIVQENAYYPFGLAHTGTDYQQSNPNNFQYNGKEKIKAFGLNWSDYGFRSMDLHTARFISIDPLATDYPHWTPYQYAGNMPISFVDLDGLEPANPPASQKPKEPSFFQQAAANFLGQLMLGIAATGAVFSGEQLTPQNFEENLQRGTEKTTEIVMTIQGSVEIFQNAAGGVSSRSALKEEANLVRSGSSVAKQESSVISSTTEILTPAPNITVPYKRPTGSTTKQMRAYVQEIGQETGCARCGAKVEKYYAGHKKALAEEYYETGKIDLIKMTDNNSIQPECPTCSNREGRQMQKWVENKNKELGIKRK